MDRAPTPPGAGSIGILAKQSLRAAVLQEHYRINEEFPGTRALSRMIAENLGAEQRLVVGAGIYLIDKGFLDPTEPGGIHYEAGSAAAWGYTARITDRGIDFVEDPTDWHGREVPSTLVYIVAGGDVKDITFASRDAQIINGDVSGVAAQGEAQVQ